MSYYYGGWAPYVSVAERRRQAEQAVMKMRKAGQAISPVTIAGRAIATTFWGRAWCDNMEAYRDYETRLPRGRSYVRNRSVVDLQIAPGRVTALVSGSELYRVAITIKAAAAAQWRAICAECTGGIDSLVELLQGRFSKPVMARLCRQESGLFPRPADIRFTCSCPDHAEMCKHVAAALYGIGARLDEQPELLFRLRAVDAADLVAGIDAALPLGRSGDAVGRMLQTDDMSALFGLDMAEPTPHPAASPELGAPGRNATRAERPVAKAPAAGPRKAAKTPSSARVVRLKRSGSAKNGASKTGSTRSVASSKSGATGVLRKLAIKKLPAEARQEHAKSAETVRPRSSQDKKPRRKRAQRG